MYDVRHLHWSFLIYAVGCAENKMFGCRKRTLLPKDHHDRHCTGLTGVRDNNSPESQSVLQGGNKAHLPYRNSNRPCTTPVHVPLFPPIRLSGMQKGVLGIHRSCHVMVAFKRSEKLTQRKTPLETATVEDI